MEATYTAQQIKATEFNINDVFGYVVDNPLPFRLIGFDESSVDGVYTAFRYCAETLDIAIASRRFCEGPVFGVYQLQTNGSWSLVHEW